MVNSVKVERYHTPESSEKDVSSIAMVENCPGPEPAEVNVCKHGHTTLSGTKSPDSGKSFPSPGSKSPAKSGSTKMSPDPGEGFPGPVESPATSSYFRIPDRAAQNLDQSH